MHWDCLIVQKRHTPPVVVAFTTKSEHIQDVKNGHSSYAYKCMILHWIIMQPEVADLGPKLALHWTFCPTMAYI